MELLDFDFMRRALVAATLVGLVAPLIGVFLVVGEFGFGQRGPGAEPGVGGAGAQPYFGRMRAIDVFGLVSERVAHEEPRSNPRAGHTKWASDTLLLQYDPTFIFSCYSITTTAKAPPLNCAGTWLARGYEQLTMHIPGMRERGEYYTFLAKKSRQFQCPGLIR